MSRHRRRRRDADGPERSPRRPAAFYADKSSRVVYVAAEGRETEKDYVELLNQTWGKRPGAGSFQIKFYGPGKSGLQPHEVVELVRARASAPDDEKWALFDRDGKDNRETSIPRAMREAAEHGVQVALSHPSFELWLLLHFQHFTSQEGGSDDAVKDRLRKHPDAKGFEKYDAASGDRGKGLGGQRGASLIGREKTAVRNARRLVDRCPHGGCSQHAADTSPLGASPEAHANWTRRTGHAPTCDALLRDPSTDVWRLLVSLGVVGDEPQG